MSLATLLCRLYGSQSWSIKSKFTERDAGYEPSKSGFAGMALRARGFREESWFLPAFNKCRMAVRVDRQGEPYEEFCTAGAGRFAGRPYGAVKASSEMGKPELRKHPIVIRKTRWDDACFLVGLEGDKGFLEEVEAFLASPRGVIFLGRKQFLPRVPVVFPPDTSGKRGIRECGLEEALEGEPWALLDIEAFKDQKPERVRSVIEVLKPEVHARIVNDVALDFCGNRQRTARYVLDRLIDLRKDP